MSAMRFALLAALVLSASAQPAPACDQARASCANSCQEDSLDVAAFLCRETVFGLLTSCTCAPSAPKPPAEPSTELVLLIEETSSDSSASSSDGGSSSSSSEPEPSSSSSSSDAAAFLPRRFGPMLLPAGFPMQTGQPQADPFAAARTAFLNDALLRNGARPSNPSLVLSFDVPQPAEGMIVFLRDEQPGHDGHHGHHHEGHHHDGHKSHMHGPHGEESDSDSDEMDMGPGCAIMTLATVAFFVGLITCCVRACLAACPRRAAMVRRSRQILVDCTAGELSSPLLVVEDDDEKVVTVVRA